MSLNPLASVCKSLLSLACLLMLGISFSYAKVASTSLKEVKSRCHLTVGRLTQDESLRLQEQRVEMTLPLSEGEESEEWYYGSQTFEIGDGYQVNLDLSYSPKSDGDPRNPGSPSMLLNIRMQRVVSAPGELKRYVVVGSAFTSSRKAEGRLKNQTMASEALFNNEVETIRINEEERVGTGVSYNYLREEGLVAEGTPHHLYVSCFQQH